MIPIVISPSQQTGNKCFVCESEENHCRQIGLMVHMELQKYNSKIVPGLISKKYGTEGSILQQVVNDSNDFVRIQGGDTDNNRGLHISVHTDADGDPSIISSGITTYFYSYGGTGERLAKNIHKRMLALSGLPNRGCMQREGLYELKNTIASAVLLEIGFHDSTVEAQWIHNNMQKIAMEIVLAIYETLELPFTQKKTWIEIINGSTINDKNGWINDIPSMIKASIANGDIGAFERLKHFKEFIEAIGN